MSYKFLVSASHSLHFKVDITDKKTLVKLFCSRVRVVSVLTRSQPLLTIFASSSLLERALE